MLSVASHCLIALEISKCFSSYLIFNTHTITCLYYRMMHYNRYFNKAQQGLPGQASHRPNNYSLLYSCDFGQTQRGRNRPAPVTMSSNTTVPGTSCLPSCLPLPSKLARVLFLLWERDNMLTSSTPTVTCNRNSFAVTAARILLYPRQLSFASNPPFCRRFCSAPLHVWCNFTTKSACQRPS